MSLEKRLASLEIGSIERLKVIASLNLGVRSEAAKRVIKKRYDRELRQLTIFTPKTG